MNNLICRHVLPRILKHPDAIASINLLVGEALNTFPDMNMDYFAKGGFILR